MSIYSIKFRGLFRFRGQTQLYKSKPSEFQLAIEEALLAENGILDTSFGTDKITSSEAYPREIQEATTSNQEEEYYSQNQAIVLRNFLFNDSFFYLHIICNAQLSSFVVEWRKPH